ARCGVHLYAGDGSGDRVPERGLRGGVDGGGGGGLFHRSPAIRSAHRAARRPRLPADRATPSAGHRAAGSDAGCGVQPGSGRQRAVPAHRLGAERPGGVRGEPGVPGASGRPSPDRRDGLAGGVPRGRPGRGAPHRPRAPDPRESLGGPPRIGRMVWRVAPGASARVAELLTSNAHLITGPPPEQFAGLAARPGIRTITRDGGLYAAVAWNMTRPPLDDARVRRALTLAIDRQALVEGLRAGFGTVAAGPIGPGHWAYDPSLEPLPHDPVAARALLVETGLVDRDGDAVLDDSTGVPFTIELLYAANSTLHRDVAQLIQKDLGEIGVRVVPRAVEFG